MEQETVNIVAVAALIFAISVIVWFLITKRRQRPSTVSLKGSSSVPFRRSEVGKLWTDFLTSSFKDGDEATLNAEHALKLLRQDPEAAIDEINFTYRTLPEQSYNARWALVYAAAKLEHEVSLDFMRYITELPIPPETSNNLCHHSTVGEETMIRTRAVSGLKALACAGNQRAQSMLFDLLKADSISIKAEAARGLLEIPGLKRAEVEERLRKELGDTYSYLLNIRIIRPEETRSLFAIRMQEVETTHTPIEKPNKKIGLSEKGIIDTTVRPLKGAPRINR